MLKSKRLFLVLLCIIMSTFFMTACASDEEKALEEAVQTANEVLENGEEPYDETTKTTLEDLVKDSEKAEETDDIVKATEDIKEATTAYENSIKQLKQVTAPEESFVIERLNTVDGISGVEAATEETDSNKLLNKEGGYTSYVAFISPDVEWYDSSESAVARGNDGGGCVETFETAEEAKERDEYLSSFDGSGMLSPGSHTVVGTLVVRTSSELTATQQKDLEAKITEALIRLDE